MMLWSVLMPFQARIRELSRRLAECKDDRDSLELARQLQAAVHEEIELLRIKVEGLLLLNNQHRHY